jgi:hypothetical protein
MPLTNAPVPGLQLVRGLYPEVGTTGALVGQDNILQNGLPASQANNPQFIGQVTLEEIHNDEMEIEDHPIEQGAPITDHSFKKPAELTMHIGWSGQQLFDLGRIGNSTPGAEYIAQLAAIYTQLIQGQTARVLYTVVTSKRQYSQMMIQGISTESDKEKVNMLGVTLHMRQVLIALTQIVTVAAPQSAQQSPQDTNPVQLTGRLSVAAAPNFNATAAGVWIGVVP